MAKRNSIVTTSPVINPRRSSLFDDIEDDESLPKKSLKDDGYDKIEIPVSVTISTELTEELDPVAPFSSPVTKTYGKKRISPVVKQPQIDVFDQLITENNSLVGANKVGETLVRGVDTFSGVTVTSESFPGNRSAATISSTNTGVATGEQCSSATSYQLQKEGHGDEPR